MQNAVASWGNEYVRNLAAEIAAEFSVRKDAEENADDLLSLVAQIVPYHMSHNAGKPSVDPVVGFPTSCRHVPCKHITIWV